MLGKLKQVAFKLNELNDAKVGWALGANRVKKNIFRVKTGKFSFSYLKFSLNCFGERPVFFLKNLKKLVESSKPDW